MKLWLKVLIAIMLTGLIAAVLVYVFFINKSHPDYADMKPEFTIPAAEFYKAFKEKTVESGNLYNGKMVEISGTMNKVESTDSLVTIVFVFNEGMFGDEGIRCAVLPRYFDEAGKMVPGTSCRIKGYCSGFNDPDILLEHCSIMK